ncbi:MalY/PatB family protein [Eubacteriaceae bacterium ES2]|nr:MalY/PatB family protein [Eubacteriaceae bacterium ES2]
MREKNLDFDQIVDRRNTCSLKYDFAERMGMPNNLLPLWVADMDFKTSSFIEEALEKQVKHGIYGYSDGQEEYFQAVEKWMKERFDWQVDRSWLIKTPGVVFALAMAVKAFTSKGEGVLIQPPVYYPFKEVIEENDRRMISNTLYLGQDNRYQIDFEDFEKKIISDKIRLFFLCNPHNPVGRVWGREELLRIGEICLKHRVIVVSDEIHADFVFHGKHQVFAALKKEFSEIAITCTAPSKTFNLAGLQISNIFIANPELKKAFRQQMMASGYSQVNVMGLIACQVAYQDGESWYRAMHTYVNANIEYVKDFLEKNLSVVKMIDHEGTYLLWLDFRGLKLSVPELEDLIINKAGLWLDGGCMFGESGAGFQRINVACPRSVLQEALTRIKKAVADCLV